MRFVHVQKATKKKGPPPRGPEPEYRSVHRAADSTVPSVSVDIVRAAESLQQRVTVDLIRDLIKRGALDRLDLAIPWEIYDEALRRNIAPNLIRTLRRSADAVSGFTADALKEALGYKPILTFDARNPRVADWIKSRTGELIKEVSSESRQAVSTAVLRSMSDEVDPIETYRTIRRSVGLTTRQAVAVQNVYERGINEGLDPSEAGLEADTYAKRQLDHRANVIARTETVRAANQGQQEGWNQAADQGLFKPKEAEVEWVTTDDDLTCPTCFPMNGVTRPFDGVWVVTLYNRNGEPQGTVEITNPTDVHPQCRCAQKLLIGG